MSQPLEKCKCHCHNNNWQIVVGRFECEDCGCFSPISNSLPDQPLCSCSQVDHVKQESCETWEDRLNDIFGSDCIHGGYGDLACGCGSVHESLEDFIHSERQKAVEEERERLRKEIEKMELTKCDTEIELGIKHTHHKYKTWFYNIAISDILNLLTKEDK